MSEEKLDEGAFTKALKAFYDSFLPGDVDNETRGGFTADVHAAILAYLAAAPKPAPERVGITEEEAKETERLITVMMRTCDRDNIPNTKEWRALGDYLRSLTTPHPVQGFEPDWEIGEDVVDLKAHYYRRYEMGALVCTRIVAINRIAYIPRPAPAKLTAEEIEREAISAGARSIERQGAPTWREEFKGGLDAYLAKKAELTALDGSPRP